jgi:hypothetical protein
LQQQEQEEITTEEAYNTTDCNKLKQLEFIATAVEFNATEVEFTATAKVFIATAVEFIATAEISLFH